MWFSLAEMDSFCVLDTLKKTTKTLDGEAVIFFEKSHD